MSPMLACLAPLNLDGNSMAETTISEVHTPAALCPSSWEEALLLVRMRIAGTIGPLQEVICFPLVAPALLIYLMQSPSLPRPPIYSSREPSQPCPLGPYGCTV